MSQVPLIQTLSSIDDENAQSAIQVLVQYLNYQDSAIQPWSKLIIQGFFATRVNPVSSAYSISDLDHTVLGDTTSSAFTVTLPSAVKMPGRQYKVICIGTKNLTIATVSGQTINGGSSYILPGKYFNVMLISDGSNWLAV